MARKAWIKRLAALLSRGKKVAVAPVTATAVVLPSFTPEQLEAIQSQG